MFQSHAASEESDLQIESINAQNLTWKANECMLTKTHPKYNKQQCEGPDQTTTLTQMEKAKWTKIEKDKKDKAFIKSKSSG